MRLGKYINNITGLQFFQLFRFGILLLISIVFSKSRLSQGEIGIYETFLLIAGGVSFFWISGLIQALMPLFKSNIRFGSKSQHTPVLFNAAMLLLVMSTLAGMLVYFADDFLADLLSLHTSSVPYLKILIAYIILSGPNNMIEYIFLLKNQSKKIILYAVVSLTLQLVFVTTPVLLGYDLGYGLYGLLAVNLLKFFLLIYLLYRYSKFEISFLYIKEHLVLAAPLILSVLLSGSASYFDGFLVSYHFSEAKFAIFRYGARELPFVVLLANAFSNAMIPEFTNASERFRAMLYMRDQSKKLMLYLYPVTILFLLTSKWLYPVVFNPDFIESAAVFNVYLLLILSRLLFPQTILVGWKKTKAIMFSSLLEMIINISISIILIKSMGIIGVAYATVIAYMIQKLVLIAYLWVRKNIPPGQYIPVKTWALWSIIL
ncbi:MAG: polysaccharide biosynthesis C-terminal domain-containing protein, partial [Bacteroidota bacterium]